MGEKTLVKIILGTIGGLIFALGMCCGIVGLLVDVLVFPIYSYLKGDK